MQIDTNVALTGSEAVPSASSPSITIASATAGTWRVSTSDDSFGGLFVSRKAALAFVLAESRRIRIASPR